MALQAGELFASFAVDTSGIEKALDRIEQRAAQAGEDLLGPRIAALGETAAAALESVLGADRGREIAGTLLEGMRGGVDNAAPALYAAMRSVGNAAAISAEESLSSGVGREIGSRFGMGMADGLMSAQAAVSRAAAGLAAEALRQATPAAVRQSASGGSAAANAAGSLRTDGAGYESASFLARAVASALSGVTVQMDGAAVGSLVAPAVSRSIARDAAARRYGTE